MTVNRTHFHSISPNYQLLREEEGIHHIDAASPRVNVITRLAMAILAFFSRSIDPVVTHPNPKPINIKNITKLSLDLGQADTKRLDDSDARLGRSELVARSRINKKRLETLNEAKGEIRKIAERVNSAWLHCSPNCDYLSQAFLHNVTSKEHKLSIKNHFVPTPTHKISERIFGAHQLKTIAENVTLEEAENIMHTHFNETGERHYLIGSTHYRAPLGGTTAHGFNAMMITTTERAKGGERDYDYVQFIDPWKTSNRTPTYGEVADQHTEKARFTIQVRVPTSEEAS